MINRKGRKDVHLLVSADIHRLAKIECAKAGLELSRATEGLWWLWSSGQLHVNDLTAAVAHVAADAIDAAGK